ncbi:hypothetical protein [Acrocarpospora pleiomorpha]|nr:hypothetical protein [Acrocarpospora pleiomorpha]
MMGEFFIEARKLIAQGCSLAELLDFWRGRESYALTPFNFMRLLREVAGISMIESREIISMFDPDFSPIAAPDEIERRWRSTIDLGGK